uniref:Immulectin n=1 Tax=Hepialus xiaojinensis TaxID=1589740 RepID=A0A219YXG6_9NEOP|nr:immulectin [Hepialus xiaojinensis]
MFKLIFLLIGAATCSSIGLPSLSFRDDYSYAESQKAFYKFHRVPRTWEVARFLCGAEGGQLASPETDEELKFFHDMLAGMPNSVFALYIGAHRKFSPSTFVNLNGKRIDSVLRWWDHLEPNENDNTEDCVTIGRNGKLNDDRCEKRFPFICKVASESVVPNTACKNFDPAYQPYDKIPSRCYKLHTEPKTWHNAYQTCTSEQSHLVVVKSADEADYLSKLIKQNLPSKVIGSFAKDKIVVGFHDLYAEGEFRTVFGEKLDNIGFSSWAEGKPDEKQDENDCGALNDEGKLEDVSCKKQFAFVCEREV